MTRLKTEPDFARAVTKAYEMRIQYSPWFSEFDVFLPISVDRRIRVCTYQTFCERNGVSIQDLLKAGASPDGFTIAKRNSHGRPYRWLILYNDDERAKTRKRFTIAHELGHVLLRHTEESDINDMEADCFARNLLSPALYVQENGLPFEQYCFRFGISKAAAHVAKKNYDFDLALATKLVKSEWDGRFKQYGGLDFDE